MGGFAIRKDNTGWRAVDDAGDLAVDEIYSDTPPPVLTGPHAEVISQIIALEMTATPRRLREAILGVDNGWLEALNAQIQALRAELQSNA